MVSCLGLGWDAWGFVRIEVEQFAVAVVVKTLTWLLGLGLAVPV